MTNEEARAILEEVKTIDDSMYQYNSAYLEALEMAIAALKTEPCEKAVSRGDTLQSFESYCNKNCQFSKKQRDVMCRACMMGDAIEIVEGLPRVTPKPRTGKWIKNVATYISQFYTCSECNRRIKLFDGNNLLEEFPYCHCGAKMTGEKDADID